MSPQKWRKSSESSSSPFAGQRFATGVYEWNSFRSFTAGALFSLLASSVEAGENLQEIIYFDIPQQRADLSLTEFAKQANITLIFPYDEAMEITTNSLIGKYSIKEAARVLLVNTRFKVETSEDGQLMITTDQSFGEIDSMYKKNKLTGAVLGALTSIAATEAVAQDSVEEEVVVTGIRASLQRSMDIKREADGVVDAISAEEIGKFPDTNLAESLQRITGVSIDRSGGEGQYITVRGFGPEFNTVLINGRQIASENTTRAFSFDTVASELVSRIDVHKSSSATIQSGGVGSTVNIKTARPLDQEGFKIAGSIKGVYDENSEETTPQVSALTSYSSDGFGILLSLSHQERETRLNQAQMDGWLENVNIPESEINGGAGIPSSANALFSPRNYDHKVTFEDRTRTNANLVLQFAPNDDVTLTGDVLYSDFDIETDATSYGHWFTASNVEDVTTDANGTVIDLYQEVGLATDMHAKKFDRLTETISYGFNVDWNVSDQLNLNFDLHTSNAEREANNGGGNQLSLIGYANRVRFIVDGGILPYATNFQEANANIFSGQQEMDNTAYLDPSDANYEAPDGVSNHLDESNSKAHVMLRRGWAVEDDIQQFKMDGVWNEDQSDGLVKAKFGLMFSREEKDLQRWDNEGVGAHCVWCGYPDDPAIPDSMQYVFDAGSDFLDEVSGSGRMPTQWLAHDGEEMFAFLDSQGVIQQRLYQRALQAWQNDPNADPNGEPQLSDFPTTLDAVRRNNSFVIEEETFAYYLELDFAGELAGRPITATTGVRVESTDVEVSGTEEPITGLNILDETEMSATFGSATSIKESKSYDAILPSLSIKWDLSDNLVARAAASKTLTRPTLDSLSPATVITTTRQGGDLTSTSGNPELEPFESENIDFSLEWYYDDTSYLSAGYFKKDVANFIVNTQENTQFTLSNGSYLLDPSTGTDDEGPDAADEVAVFRNTIPTNGETVVVEGLELAVQHAFGESGFGVIANFTFVSSNADLNPSDVTQVFALTGLSDSRNLVGYYEKGPIQLRLAYNWRDEFVQSLTQVQGDGPTIVEDYKQWDLSASYDIMDNVSLFLEGINLTEEYVHKRGRFDNHLLLIEDSGRRLAFGVRANF